ncbi:hypothetical protein CS542_09265 [Pedobacter sp. IW39]|nr:hypothetical protein CS542_09265 [Pedobacter sp. IW39]
MFDLTCHAHVTLALLLPNEYSDTTQAVPGRYDYYLAILNLFTNSPDLFRLSHSIQLKAFSATSGIRASVIAKTFCLCQGMLKETAPQVYDLILRTAVQNKV